MEYTTLGSRTGLRVSVLGFGAMRLPMREGLVDRNLAIPMMHHAFEQGVNYIDTAVGYCNRDSQRAVGEALEGWRDRIVVSTKNHQYGRKDYDAWHRNLEDSLTRLRTDSIDIYNLHGLNWNTFREQVDGPGGSYAWMAKAKEQGLIRHICFSFHDTPEALVKIAETGLFDVVTCQYNLLNPENGTAFAAVRKQGMGIVVMGPVGGGRLGAPSEALRKLIPGAASVPEVAMRYVLANPDVNVALSGMSTLDQVKENCRVCSRKTPLSTSGKRNVTRVLNRYRKLSELYCTGCGYCMPCPSGVNIPANFDNFNKLRVYGLEELARQGYAQHPGPARYCIACGRCMSKCPQHLDIIAQLRDTVRHLDDAYGKLAVTLRPRRLERLRRRGRQYAFRLAAEVVCTSYADETVETKLTFDGGAAVSIAPQSITQRVAAFERKTRRLSLEGTADAAAGIPLNLRVDTTGDVAGPAAALHLAPARGGGRRSLAHAVLLPLRPKGARPARRPAADGPHLEFATAYDTGHLYLRARISDAGLCFRNPRRTARNTDRVVIDFDLRGLARPRGELPLVVKRQLQVLLPEPGRRACPVRLSTGGDGVEAKAVPVKGATRLDVRIPWGSLDCPPGKPDKVLGLNVTLQSFSSRGKPRIDREWVPGGTGGWIVLL